MHSQVVNLIPLDQRQGEVQSRRKTGGAWHSDRRPLLQGADHRSLIAPVTDVYGPPVTGTPVSHRLSTSIGLQRDSPHRRKRGPEVLWRLLYNIILKYLSSF